MPNGRSLEFTTLPTLHPSVGEAWLLQFAPSAIVRLSIDPTPPASKFNVQKDRSGLDHASGERSGFADISRHLLEWT